MRTRRPIRQRLAEFYTEIEIELWFCRPHPQLADMPPRALIDQGRAEEVHALIDRLDAGAYI